MKRAILPMIAFGAALGAGPLAAPAMAEAPCAAGEAVVYFQPDGAKLTAANQEMVARYADQVKACGRSAVVEVRVDARELAEARSAEIVRALAARGVRTDIRAGEASAPAGLINARAVRLDVTSDNREALS